MHAILAARFTPDPKKPRPCATDVAIVPILPSRKSWQKLGLPGPLQVRSVVLVVVGLEVQSPVVAEWNRVGRLANSSTSSCLAYITPSHAHTVEHAASSIATMSDQNSTIQNIGSVGTHAYQTFVELPYQALTTPRQAEIPAKKEGDMGDSPDKAEHHVQDQKFTSPIDDKLLKLLTSPESVSTLLAQDPSLTPGEAWKKLYGHHVGKLGHAPSINETGKHLASEEALHKAAEAGHWGPTQPSELFLRVSYI